MRRLRQAKDNGTLAPRGIGMGAHLEDAMAALSAAPMAMAAFGVRRAPEIARLSVDDARADDEAGAGEKQYRFRQLSHLLDVRPWAEVCPVRPLPEWMRARAWVGRHRGLSRRMSGDPMARHGNSVPNALFARLSRARYGTCGCGGRLEKVIVWSSRLPPKGGLACTSRTAWRGGRPRNWRAGGPRASWNGSTIKLGPGSRPGARRCI